MTDFMSDGEKKYFAIGGGCVITMEFVTGTTSSLSRMFLTELGKNDVDNEKLRFFQENRWILPTHIYDFLCFVTGDFENVVRYIKNRFVELRNRHQFVFGRYAEAYTVLMLVAEILVYYAKTRGFFTDSEVEENLKLVETILLAEFQRMEGRIRSLDKGTVIVDALKDGLFTHKLIPVILNDENSGQRCPCYQNDVIIFLQMKELQRIIFEYCKSYHLGDISMSSDELLMHLERMELLDIKESEGQKIRSRKLPVQHGNTLRYLYIKKENLQGFDV